MRKILSIIVSLIVSAPLFSQYNAITVNGLKLSFTFIEAQLIDSLGVPSIIDYGENIFQGWVTYKYADNTTGRNNDFLFIDGSLQQFHIRSNNFKLNNFLEVGMDISAVNQMGGVIFNSKTDLFYWAPSEEYKNTGYTIIHFNPVNQKITTISVTTTSDSM